MPTASTPPHSLTAISTLFSAASWTATSATLKYGCCVWRSERRVRWVGGGGGGAFAVVPYRRRSSFDVAVGRRVLLAILTCLFASCCRNKLHKPKHPSSRTRAQPSAQLIAQPTRDSIAIVHPTSKEAMLATKDTSAPRPVSTRQWFFQKTKPRDPEIQLLADNVIAVRTRLHACRHWIDRGAPERHPPPSFSHFNLLPLPFALRWRAPGVAIRCTPACC